MTAIFEREIWAAVPFHFWSLVLFVFGTMVGSFLNVCIHRMPHGESIVSPPSHCPKCGYQIPWYFNIPLLTWLMLRGRCAQCKQPIPVRYLLVELLTGCLFLVIWLVFGSNSALLALAYCVFMSGLIVATFIDFEHFIIPDEITIGGLGAGVVLSLLIPALHGTAVMSEALKSCFIGIAVGAGLVYAILRLGKLMFGKHRIDLDEETTLRFTETALELPDNSIPYEELFYRPSDAITLVAKTVRLGPKDLSGPLPEKEWTQVSFRLTPSKLTIEDEEFNPEEVASLVVVTNQVVLPREAMGLGDVKFMAAIGGFIGWKGVVFSLMVSSVLGSIVGVAAILLRRQEWSSRIPYGPYIAIAAALYLFWGATVISWIFPTLPPPPI